MQEFPYSDNRTETSQNTIVYRIKEFQKSEKILIIYNFCIISPDDFFFFLKRKLDFWKTIDRFTIYCLDIPISPRSTPKD